MALPQVQTPIISDIGSARVAIDRAYALITSMSQSSQAQIEAIRVLAASGYLTPAQVNNINTQLTIAGSAPLDLTGLNGAGGGQVAFGTYSAMQSTPPFGLFYTTDLFALYAAVNNPVQWILMSGNSAGSYGARPGTLGLNDAGYVFFAQDRGVLLYWTGASWRWQVGTYTDVFSNRPIAATLTASSGVFFSASDLGYQLWRFDRVAPKWQFVGGGEPVSNTLGNIGIYTALLGVDDVGFLFYATDFDRVYVWTGAGWSDGDGQPSRGFVQGFDINPTSNGWQYCDGSTVTRSTETGGTASVTVPNLVTVPTFPLFGSGVSTGTFGAVGANYDYWRSRPYYRL